ncbi:12366_t:CDS:2 [Entrophospora sp. SA101]|nr:12366_t:CDS:2 [Entrophospora sp. SA101]
MEMALRMLRTGETSTQNILPDIKIIKYYWTGQDGSYLTEFLLENGHTVHGIIRRSSSFNTGRLEYLYKDQHERPKMALHLWKADRFHIVSQVFSTEIYNPGGDIDGLRTLRLLDAIRIVGLANHVRFYQKLHSQKPHHFVLGIAKLYAYWIVVDYREAYNMFACNGVLFNHKPPRRGRTFVTRKIYRAVAEIHLNKQSCIYLDNIDSKRDWGHTRDYIEFVEKSFAVINKTIVWKSEDENMVGSEVDAGIVRVCVDPKYFRPT